MRTFEFIPSICTQEDAKWEGNITLKKFSFDEKFTFMQKVEGDYEDGHVYTTSQYIDKIRRAVALSEKFYVSVNLKNKETGLEIKSFEDMSYEDSLHKTMVEISSKLMETAKLGNG